MWTARGLSAMTSLRNRTSICGVVCPLIPQIAALNDWLRGYAKANGFTYVDYHAALSTPAGAMKPGYATDGVHPTPQGYAVMRPLATAAIAKALGR
jgi:lysophospholipase L1-like esterase